MRDQYVGDVGDYVKLGLLYHLEPERLGVIWYKTGGDSQGGDGKYTDYLHDPKNEKFDCLLFKALKRIVCKDEDRRIERDERILACLKPKPSFFGDKVDGEKRDQWFKQACKAMKGCDLVFVDPDNGLHDPDNGLHKDKESDKHISLGEVKELMNKYCSLLIYHHQTRKEGGHKKEIECWQKKLAGKPKMKPLAIRAGKSSPRAFFLLTKDKNLQERFRKFAEEWESFLKTNIKIPHFYD